MNILVAIDSFKGTLSSSELSQIIHDFFVPQGHQVHMIPISDGGEGFIESIQIALSCPIQSFPSYGPLMDPMDVHYILHDKTAYIELHAASGITRIAKQRLNPMKTTTYGLGLLIKHVINEGATQIVIGLGGSATNDGGAGMLQAMGMKFYHENLLIEEPMNGELLGSIDHIDHHELNELIQGIHFEIASDVTNPLLGSKGSTHVFSKQKGATFDQIQTLESNMTHYASIIEKTYQTSFLNHSGAGAAGGVGFAALTCLNAKLHSGISYMIDFLDLESKIKQSDVVIVGEGKLDFQTRFGKAPFGIASIAKKHDKKVIGLFGSSTERDVSDYIDHVYVVVPDYATEEESLEHAAYYFKKMLSSIAL